MNKTRILPLTLLAALGAQLAGCYEVVGPDDIADAAPPPDDAATVRCPVTPAAPLAIASVRDRGYLRVPSRVTGGGGFTVDTHLGPRWLFAEVGLHPTAGDARYRVNATLAMPVHGDPLAVADRLDAFGAPVEALPYRTEEISISALNPGGYLALWPNGSTVPVGARTAVFVARWRVRPGFLNLTADGVEAAWFVGDDRPIERTSTLLYRADEVAYAPFAVDGDNVYLQNCRVVGHFDAECHVARVTRADIFNRAAYRYWDGIAWVSDPSRAIVAARHMNGFTATWNRHLQRWVALYAEILGNRIFMQTARHPEGPYSGPIPVHAPTPPRLDNLHSAALHPRLSDSEGCALMASWYEPTSAHGGVNHFAEITLR